MHPQTRLMTIAAGACLLLPASARAQLFLVDDARTPHVKVFWPTRGDDTIVLEQDRPYRGVNDRVPLGRNLECFVAVGGLRTARGAGHPNGFVIRLGFVKADLGKPFFDELADDAEVTFELSNIAFTAPAMPLPKTTIQEIGYGRDPNLCGVPGQPDAQYNTTDAADDLRGKITAENGRLGILDGSAPGHGQVTVTTRPDGAIAMSAHIPYALFRHVKDPWQNTKPGGFNEPNHFHIEFEVVPAPPPVPPAVPSASPTPVAPPF
jgi:hypothetical protein